MAANNLLLDEHPLIILPKLACQIGLEEAIILQQVHYWLLRSKNEFDGRPWVYKTYAEWQNEFPFWSIPTIRRKISGLEKNGVLLVGNYNQYKLDQTKWYSINYNKLDKTLSPPM